VAKANHGDSGRIQEGTVETGKSILIYCLPERPMALYNAIVSATGTSIGGSASGITGRRQLERCESLALKSLILVRAP